MARPRAGALAGRATALNAHAFYAHSGHDVHAARNCELGPGDAAMRPRYLRLSAVGVAALAAVASAQTPAPAQERACTLVGCASGISVKLSDDQNRLTVPRSARVTLCMDQACRRFGPGYAWVRLNVPSQDSEGPVRVRIILRGRRGRVLLRSDSMVTLTRTQPNGPECEPVCWEAAFEIQRGYRLVRTL